MFSLRTNFLVLGFVACGLPRLLRADVIVEKIEYLRWHDAVRVRNGTCTLVVVPQVGRVMFFGRTGGKNVLYNNESLAGQTVPKDDGTWHDFGGDKVWPTQQDWWIRYTDRNGWPPPYFSDAAPQTAEPIEQGLRLTSALSPEFGTRTIREFVMDPKEPLVYVRQWFKKEEGKPVVMSLWTVTQVCQPDFALLPTGEPIDGKPFKNLADRPPNAEVGSGSVVLKVDPAHPQKIGVAPAKTGGSDFVAAVFGDELFVESRRSAPGGGYPDGNCSGELFTADAALKLYVEMELLSPLRELKPGDTLRDDCVWQIATLGNPGQATPESAFARARSLHASALSRLTPAAR